MKLSDKAQAALDAVVQQFRRGDLSPVVQVARIQREGEPIPSERWSLSNRIMAHIQTGDLDCRGYCQWQKAGRRVRKGERAAYILAPCLVPVEDEETVVLEALDLKLPAATIAAIQESIEDRMMGRPENSCIQDDIDDLQDRRERLRELYLMGEYKKDDYLAQRSVILDRIEELERKLSGPDYSLEAKLQELDKVRAAIREGSRTEQKKALRLLFEKLSIDSEGIIREVELHPWARPLFADLLIVNGDHECPQGTSSAHHVATLARLKPSQPYST